MIEGLTKESKDSRRSIEMYISLCRLIDPLMVRVDSGEIRLSQADLISKLRIPEQEMLEEIISKMGWHISIAQAKKLRKASQERTLTKDELVIILDPAGISIRKVTLSNEFINKYFPPEYTSDQVMQIIADLIENYRDHGEDQ